MKAELIRELQEEYQNWQALLAQIDPARMDEPGVAGDWSVKDMVAHLTGWRRRLVARLRSLQLGQSEVEATWPAHLTAVDEINDWIYQTHKDLSVSEVLAESDQVFQTLLAVIESLPEEVIETVHQLPWMNGYPFNAAELFSHFHEEHEPELRAWMERSMI